MGLIGFMLLAAVAVIRPDADVASPQPQGMLQECLRGILAGANVDQAPLDRGMRVLVRWPGRPGRLLYDLTDVDGARHLAVTHEPPATRRAAKRAFRRFGRQCFPEELASARYR